MQTSILDLFQCIISFETGECIFNQNLKTLIFTYALPLEQCALGILRSPKKPLGKPLCKQNRKGTVNPISRTSCLKFCFFLKKETSAKN